MHKISTAVLLLLTTHLVFSQDFCGRIRYQYKYYKTKTNEDITSQSKDIKVEDFYICEDKFKIYMDGKLKEILIGDSLIYYYAFSDSLFLSMKADSSYRKPKSVYTNYKNRVEYKDKVYSTVELNERRQKVVYYFDQKIRIDPVKFKNIQIYHWNEYFKSTNGALRLVSINTKKKIISISEAIEIKWMKSTDIDFTLPKDYKVEPVGYFRVY